VVEPRVRDLVALLAEGEVVLGRLRIQRGATARARLQVADVEPGSQDASLLPAAGAGIERLTELEAVRAKEPERVGRHHGDIRDAGCEIPIPL
jgi:hypothetical protein